MPNSQIFSKQPLYTQVRELLAQRIGSGVWKPGGLLPNEHDLSRELGVSIGTVRKALGTLEADGLVMRRQGRGTFVVDQASEEVALRFTNIRDASGQKVAADLEMLDQSSGTANAEEQERLILGPDDIVVRTRRIRRHGGETAMLETASLAVGRFPGLDPNAVGNYRLPGLAQRHGLQLARATECVRADAASKEVAAELGVVPGTPLLVLQRLVLAKDGQPVEWRVAQCHLGGGESYVAETG